MDCARDNVDTAIIYIHGSGHGLPSVDPKCLQLLFYLCINPTDKIRIKTSSTTDSHRFPVMKRGRKLITKFERIMEEIEILSEPWSDLAFSVREQQLIHSLKMVNYRILESPLILNFWSLDENMEYFEGVYSNTKIETLRESYIESLRLFNVRLIARILSNRSLCNCISLGNTSFDYYMDNLTFLLSCGGGPFMFGETPSSYDAYLCGYLVPLLKYDFPKSEFKNILLKYPRMVNYVGRFISFYKAVDLDIQGEAADAEIKEQKKAEEEEEVKGREAEEDVKEIHEDGAEEEIKEREEEAEQESGDQVSPLSCVGVTILVTLVSTFIYMCFSQV